MALPDKLLAPYNASTVEPEMYARWEKSGFFNPETLLKHGVLADDAEPFSMVLPPPNVTGILHMGSAMMIIIEDIFTRFARMNGRRTLWIPGTDSAAIATQSRVEKDIQKKEGKNRHDIGREELLKRIDVFVEENKASILKQIRLMGASLDWTRYAYTMDAARYRAVTEAFVRMYRAGLIYRDTRIVNWDPKGQTVISDDEVEYEERSAMLYTFRYWKDFPIAISTTRPETKVGDSAVAVHPDDARYAPLVGKTFEGTFAGAPLRIKIVADTAVDPEFGTGALGVTPAHSMTDADIAVRHNLSRPQVIDEYAKMTQNAGELVRGMKVLEAREKIVAWLRDHNLLEREESIPQNISVAQRTGGIIEPLPKLQWFISVTKPFIIPQSEIPGIKSGTETTLKEIMKKSVESGAIKILPERFERSYFHWIDNLRDWCISRQIWFGHRIPIWYRAAGQASEQPEIYCGITPPEGEGWEQDPDVLDTWFSSALWTFSTLGWPQTEKHRNSGGLRTDLDRYHPMSILETGYDILPFWVARMILMSGFHLGEVPFRTVYLHGLVRDGQGRKISKSLGNNIDPVDMAKKFGTDAVRMSLIVGTAPGADSKISEDKIKAYKHFANKIWNAARFVLENTEHINTEEASLSPDDQKRYDELSALALSVTEDIQKFHLHIASEKLYQYFWHTFADVVIESCKPRLKGDDLADTQSAAHLLKETLKTMLLLLHPFMPFITEELWQYVKKNAQDRDLLMISAWPSGNEK